MLPMQIGIPRGYWRAVKPICAILAGLSIGINGYSDGLTLEEVERLALSHDPSIQAVQAESQALQEMAVAAGQLPDPLLKLGMMALPVDSFDLSQEAMTQLQVGVVQRFPRGRSRALQSEQIVERSRSMDQIARDRRMQITRTVRETYLDVILQMKLANLTSVARNVFLDLAEITQDYYASGRAQQQDVLRAVVELGRIEERAARITQEEERARARLAVYISDSAYLGMQGDWPRISKPMLTDAVRERLPNHPRILALAQQILAADKGVELARQKYRPQFALDVTYGGRSGYNPDGSSRADLLSLMLTMDVPLFTANRQDRVTAAKVAESSAAMFSRDDILRRMNYELDLQFANLQRQTERLELYEKTLLPQAAFSADASFEAYQSSVGDLTALMRARITEYELQLEHARLQSELLKTQARLLYLQGDLS